MVGANRPVRLDRSCPLAPPTSLPSRDASAGRAELVVVSLALFAQLLELPVRFTDHAEFALYQVVADGQRERRPGAQCRVLE